jgi:molybdopterin synthase catalytic subunit
MRSISIQTEDFDVGEQWRAMHEAVAGRAGAVAAFCGLVRERFEEQAVATLFLEHYPGMTERTIEAILDEATTRFCLQAVQVIHRVGALAPGDQIVLVLCAAPHRAEAFEACQFVMDYLKTKAMFWKKEAGQAGERWVQSSAADHERLERWES